MVKFSQATVLKYPQELHGVFCILDQEDQIQI